MGVSAVVLGASGYGGGELVRFVHGHPAVELAGIAAGSSAGRALGAVAPHLAHELPGVDLGTIADIAAAEVDVCFSALPAGELDRHASHLAARVVIDLADDHRADDTWVYGLTEFARPLVAGATRIANPGCYPTAALLAVVPFLAAGLIEGPITIDALSGASGAGRAPATRLLLAELHGDAGAYGATVHRHVPEMERAIAVFAGTEVVVSFTPHLVPIARGLLVTLRARLVDGAADTVPSVLHESYADEPFVSVSDDWPHTKWVAGTNRAVVHARVDERASLLVAACVIDNLGKGAAGQAVQNANVALGIEETAGLPRIAQWP